MLSWVEIDRKAIVANYKIFTQLAAPATVAPVLKANAYGHGLVQVYDAIKAASPLWIAVNYVFEATELRALGFKGHILVCGPITADMFEEAIQSNADVFIGSHSTLSAFLQLTKPLRIHIEFDTGMSRQGFMPAEASTIAKKLKSKAAQIIGICMHFANIEDVMDQDYANLQLKRFDQAISAFQSEGLKIIKHAASSASCLILPKSRFDLERIGISLYGLWPSQATKLSFAKVAPETISSSSSVLTPALSWRTKITSTIPVAAGEYIGYGCTFRANRPMHVAVLPVGYHEGYPRSCSGTPAYVLIRGERCPLVGRICMNMMMVDVTNLESKNTVNIGEIATLIGTDNFETISAGDVSTWAGTINYEIVSRIHPSIERRLV